MKRDYDKIHYHMRDWRLKAVVSWEVKDDLSLTIDCEACGGKGGRELSGMFSMEIDPPTWEDCETCYGNKTVRNPEIEKKPARIPADYIDHMRKAHIEFLDSKIGKEKRYL